MNADPPSAFPAEPRHADETAGPARPVVILLASYQGAAFIGAQLDSIAAQTWPHWRLLVSDDGSGDNTRAIVSRFAQGRPSGQVRLIQGPRKGATRNFLHLILAAPSGHALAFCDQDDSWFPDKLSRAVAALDGVAGPAHYAARTVIADADLRPIRTSRRFMRPFGFANALVQACMAGNTSVFNADAAALLQTAAVAARDADVPSHDWWAYQISAGAGARLIHDARPALLYRQHPRSEMGRNDTPTAMMRRFGRLLAGDYGTWLRTNVAALQGARDLLTPENRALLDTFATLLDLPGPVAAHRLRRLGLYRHDATGSAALWTAAALGRLRQAGSPRIPSR